MPVKYIPSPTRWPQHFSLKVATTLSFPRKVYAFMLEYTQKISHIHKQIELRTALTRCLACRPPRAPQPVSPRPRARFCAPARRSCTSRPSGRTLAGRAPARARASPAAGSAAAGSCARARATPSFCARAPRRPGARRRRRRRRARAWATTPLRPRRPRATSTCATAGARAGGASAS